MEEKDTHFKINNILGKVYIALMCITPFLCTFIIEYMGNAYPEALRALPIAIEILVCGLFELLLVGLFPFGSAGLILCYALSALFGAANFYLLRFRDIPLMLMDITAVKTAVAVASGYDFTPEPKLVIGITISIIAIVIILILHRPFKKQIMSRFSYIKSLTIALFSLAGIIVLIGFIPFSQTFGIVMNMWKPGFTYAENGSLSSFICYAQFSSIGKPKGYDKKEVEQVLKEAEKEFDKSQKYLKSDIHPTIISIMDESFADLSVLGPIECTKNHLAFYYSLKNDPGTIWHGYNYVSTYAGGTARTEYEWLTGYSMRTFPNAQPYSQFKFNEVSTCIDNFKANGYETIAMHPERESNYRRNTVYEQMGFDKFLSLDDYKGYGRIPFLKERVSDIGNYKKLIDTDKSVEGPLFIHNVTMGNHGGFDFYLSKNDAVSVDNEYSRYSDLVRYETLLANSDLAIEELINHYRNSKESVIICLYGDHLPKLNEDFVLNLIKEGYDNSLTPEENEEKRFKIPFFIWSNMDIENEIKPHYINGEISSSTNYLGVVTRAMAGLKLSAFDKYLLLLREKVPVVNESGYVVDGRWHASNEETEYSSYLDEYEKIQYAGMFDRDGLEYLFSGE